MMHLQLITLSGVRLDAEVYELIAPTLDGDIAIFPGHEPLVTVAVPGALAIRRNKKDPDTDLDIYAISGGVIEVSPKNIRVLVDDADASADITEADAAAALKHAQQLRDEAKDQVEREKAMQLIDRHTVRLKVADLHRRRRS